MNMKWYINRYKNITSAVLVLLLCGSCNEFLEREPLDKITPEQYFRNEADLAAYTIGQYGFGTYSGFSLSLVANDNDTDNQAASGGSNALWVPGEKRTPAKGGGWDFSAIRKYNYFFEQVMPKYEAKQIQGNSDMIEHYIGEMYFLRAFHYFGKVTSYGDFPIITKTYPDVKEALVEISKRRPRNEVVRFILSDLDEAIRLMMNSTTNGKNRLTKNVALLMKSRIALHEATWLKYHQGSNRVPGGPGWIGASADYNTGFEFDINAEINWLLEEAMKASQAVADAVALVDNSGVYNPKPDQPYGWNPYFEMFSAIDMEPIEEVLFWRAYDKDLGIAHAVSIYLAGGGGNSGYTRSMIEAFLMKNGLPIYTPNSGYEGDVNLNSVKKNRDDRLQLFVAEPSDMRRLTDPVQKFDAPKILDPSDTRVPTGYSLRKFLTYDPQQIGNCSGTINTFGCIIFRAVEAHLNYIEACYEKNGFLDAKALDYWKKIRRRAGVSDNIEATIAATDLSKENDWAKYSGDNLVDATLFNIRRERRVELMSESTRMRDLKRWRALDRVKNYQIEGFNLWGGEIEKMYIDKNGKTTLIPQGTTGKQANVSDKGESGNYLRPYQIVKANNLLFDGYTWAPENYLEPIAAIHFTMTASDPNDPETSVIYQNPGWSKIANQPGLDY